MQRYNLNLFNQEAFVEFYLIKSYFNFHEKSIVMEMNGAWFADDNTHELSKAILKISGWSSLKITLLNEHTKQFEEVLTVNEDKYLERIVEFHVENKTLRLCGFGNHCGWMEWIFEGAKTEIYGEQ